MRLPEVWQSLVPQTYANVDPTSGTTALQSVAIWATSDLIASTVSRLPVDVFANGSSRPVPENILDPGGDGSGRKDWLYRLLMSWLLRGNAYGFETSWNSAGKARTVDLLNPNNVTAQAVDGEVHWYHKGVRLEGAMRSQFKHWRVNPQPGQELGLSVVEAHAVSIGVSLRSAQFGDQWFREGAHPSSALINKAQLSDVDADQAKARLLAATNGSRAPLVLGEGWEFKALQVNPNESQFLETLKFSEAQCARLFGAGFAEILGYESGGSMTYANVSDRDLFLLKYSLDKWVDAAEDVLTELLPPSTQRVLMNRDAMLKSTTMQRYQAHKVAIDSGWRLPSEVRELEDLKPIPGIDDRKPNTQGVSSGNAAQL